MERLKEILDTMDVPELRKDGSIQSIAWLNRNLAFRNSEHPDFKEAMNLIKGVL